MPQYLFMSHYAQYNDCHQMVQVSAFYKLQT